MAIRLPDSPPSGSGSGSPALRRLASLTSPSANGHRRSWVHRPLGRLATFVAVGVVVGLVLVFLTGGSSGTYEEYYEGGFGSEGNVDAGSLREEEMDRGAFGRPWSEFQPHLEKLLPHPAQRPPKRPSRPLASYAPCPDVYDLPGGYLAPPSNWSTDPSGTEYRIPVSGSAGSTATFVAPSWSRRLLERGIERGIEMKSREARKAAGEEIQEEAGGWGQLEWMRDQTVLMLGDSIDRNGVFHLGTQLASAGFTHRFLTPETTKLTPLPNYPTTNSHLIGVSHHGGLNLTVANWFLMSIVAGSESHDEEVEPFFNPGEDMPQYWASRLEQLYLPSVSRGVIPTPSVVIVYSGFWDLVYFGKKKLSEAPEPKPLANWPLTDEELARYRSRLSQLFRWLRVRFPHARLVYRTMHETTEGADDNPMCRARIRQLDESARELVGRGAMKDVVRDVMPWGEKVKGREEEMHGDVAHFGIGSAQWLYHDMLLDQLRRHVLGPTKSEWVECREYRRLSSTGPPPLRPPSRPRRPWSDKGRRQDTS